MLEVPVKPTFFPTTAITSADAATYRQVARYALDDLQHAIANYAWKRVEVHLCDRHCKPPALLA